MDVHEKLRMLARKRGVSNAEIGRNTGISRGRVSHFMTTESRPLPWQLTALADYFGVAVDSLMDDRLPLRYVKPGAESGLPPDAIDAPAASPVNAHERLILEMSRALGYDRATRRLLAIGLEEALGLPGDATRTPAPAQSQTPAPSPAPEPITPAAASPGPEPAPSEPGPATQGGGPPIIPIRSIDSSTTAADIPSPPPADPAPPAGPIKPDRSREPRGDDSRQGPPGNRAGRSSSGHGRGK